VTIILSPVMKVAMKTDQQEEDSADGDVAVH